MGFPSKNPERKPPKITENALLAELKLKERMGHLNAKVLENHLCHSRSPGIDLPNP
jgi:hypothetical protein